VLSIIYQNKEIDIVSAENSVVWKINVFRNFRSFFSKKKFLIKRELENKNISNKKELPFLLWVLLQLWMYEHGPFKSDLERFLESIYRYSNCSLTASSYLFPEYLAAACHFNLILCSARLRINARWDSRRWSQPRWLSRPGIEIFPARHGTDTPARHGTTLKVANRHAGTAHFGTARRHGIWNFYWLK